MYKIFAITSVMLVVFASCAKKTAPVSPNTPSQPVTPQNPNPTPTNTTARFIPNWQTDTLRGPLMDANGKFVSDSATGYQLFDTIYTYTINDTSFVEHNGVRFYLWWEPITNTDTFKNNDNTYGNCTISLSPQPNTGINQYMVSAVPHKYWNDNLNTWGTQQQILYGFDFYIYHTPNNPKGEVYLSYYASIK